LSLSGVTYPVRCHLIQEAELGVSHFANSKQALNPLSAPKD